MGATSKCYVLSVVMMCALSITVGLIFNVFTIALIPSRISQPLQHTIAEIVEEIAAIPSPISQSMQHTIVEIDEEIKEKVPKWKMPALVWIILFDFLIILSAMTPKMTFDQCKKSYGGMKRWCDVASLASFTVSL